MGCMERENGAGEWGGFGPSVSSPADPASCHSTLPATSDALATPFRSIAGHSHSSTQPLLPHSYVVRGVEGPKKPPLSAGRLKTPPQRLSVAVFNSLEEGVTRLPLGR